MKDFRNDKSFFDQDKEKDQENKNQYNSMNSNDSKKYLNQNEINIISQKENSYKQYEKKIDNMIND
jgi:hypothetical protein